MCVLGCACLESTISSGRFTLARTYLLMHAAVQLSGDSKLLKLLWPSSGDWVTGYINASNNGAIHRKT